MTVIRRLARPMLATTFIYGGVQALRNTSAVAEEAKHVNDGVRDLAAKVAPQVQVPADDATLVRINAALHLVGGFGLATNRFPRVSALLLAGSIVPSTIAGHPFWAKKGSERDDELSHFLTNVSALGGLVLAAVDTEGKPGVTWRATHAAGSARRSAASSANSLRKQAKKTAKNVKS